MAGTEAFGVRLRTRMCEPTPQRELAHVPRHAHPPRNAEMRDPLECPLWRGGAPDRGGRV